MGGTRPRVVTVGYLAPYKGIESFLDAAEALRSSAEFHIVGDVHRVLSEDSSFTGWVEEVKKRAHSCGVIMHGYLPEGDLFHYLENCTLGVLPYTSSSGASASLSTLASAGVPVVASDLPEFRYVQSAGAGIVLASTGRGALVSVLKSLIGNEGVLRELSSRQLAFARDHNWCSFTEQLLERVEAKYMSGVCSA